MPASFSTSYVVPAILLNPCIVLHFFNTAISHFRSSGVVDSTSPHQYLERFGPAAHSDPYIDIHTNDQLCWGYTFLMVIIQLLAFGRVSDNRVHSRRRGVRRDRPNRRTHYQTTLDIIDEHVSIDAGVPVNGIYAGKDAVNIKAAHLDCVNEVGELSGTSDASEDIIL